MYVPPEHASDVLDRTPRVASMERALQDHVKVAIVVLVVAHLQKLHACVPNRALRHCDVTPRPHNTLCWSTLRREPAKPPNILATFVGTKNFTVQGAKSTNPKTHVMAHLRGLGVFEDACTVMWVVSFRISPVRPYTRGAADVCRHLRATFRIQRRSKYTFAPSTKCEGSICKLGGLKVVKHVVRRTSQTFHSPVVGNQGPRY
jgi:hypothetical protein